MTQDDADKEKESIEEILGDLNALLNKMPAILSDIKMPEIKPVEIPSLSDVSVAPMAPRDLAEGGSEDGEQAEQKTKSEPVWDAAKEAVTVFPQEPVEIEKSKLEIESLGDSIVEEMQRRDEAAEPEQEKPVPQKQPSADSLSGQTADMAVPDIDDLLKLSSESLSVKEEEQGGGMSLNENNQEDKEIKKEPEQTPQEKEYMETVKLDPSELEFLTPQALPEQRAYGSSSAGDIVPLPADAKAMADEPAAQTGQGSEIPTLAPTDSLLCHPLQADEKQAGGQEELQGKTNMPQDKMETGPGESMEQPQALGEQTPSADGLSVTKEEVSAQTAETRPESLEVKTSQQDVASSLEMSAVSGGIEIQKKIDLNPVQSDFGQTLPGQETVSLSAGGETSPQTNLGGQPSASASGGGEAAEEKTVMWSGQDPSLTSRIQLEDINLDDVASKTPPESIPSERVKTLAFLYSMGDEKLCASMLAKIDSICLKSRTKPMFVKRSFVRVFEPDMKGAYLLELASQSACSGVVCVGNIPHENVYDIENSFNSSNLFFRHINYDNFTHSVMVDMIADLILL